MKKFAKVTALISLGLAVLALIFITVGTIGGGASKLSLMALRGDLNFGPDDIHGAGSRDRINVEIDLDDESLFSKNHEIFSAGKYETDTEGETVNKLVISVGGGDIDVLQGDKDYWEVCVDGVGKFQTYVENETLYVLGKQKGVNVDLGDVQVFAPKGGEALLKAVISLGAGDMSIEYLAAEDVEISVGAGALEVEEVQADELELAVGAGEIEVGDGMIHDLVASVGMGAIYIESAVTGDVQGSVAMGELVVIVEGSDENDHNYDVSCGAGELVVGSRSYSGVGVSADLDNNADTTYELDCALGTIRIIFE